MKGFWICAVAFLFTCTERGFSQTVPCSLERQCTNIVLVNTVEECCSQADTLTFRTSVDAELCQNCFIYGWVQDIAEDRMSASPQEDILATPEGEIITLNLYFTKNGPSNVRGLLLNIQTNGTARVGEDYTLSISSDLPLQTSPIPVNVTLLRDGEAGEPLETIILTLVQDNVPDISQILDHQTVQITVQDNDLETGFGVSELTISESTTREQVCLMTQGTPASDTTITVTFTPGTAGEDDFTLLTQQVMITPTQSQPCVDFIAIADSLGLEGDETLSLNLTGPDNVIFGISTLDITITDADVVTFEFIDADENGGEETQVIDVRVTRSVATAAPITLTITPTPHSDSFGLAPIPDFDLDDPNIATPGADYPTDVLTIPVAPGSGTIDIQVPIFDDNIAENTNQYFIGVLAISGDSAGAVLGETDSVLLGIVDDESNIIIGFEQQQYTVTEEDMDLQFDLVITRSLPSEQTYTIRLQSALITAEAEDFSLPPTAFRFPPDLENLIVSVTITGDTSIELSESFNLFAVGIGEPRFLRDGTSDTTVTIEDNDGDYMYVPAESPIVIAEGETRTVSFVLSNPPPGNMFEFPFNVSLVSTDNTAIAGDDYDEIVEVFISANELPNGELTLSVRPFDDDAVELAESFRISGAVSDSDVIPVVFRSDLEVIIDSDDTATLQFVETAVTTVEGTMFEVCLAEVLDTLEASFTVQLTVGGGSAERDTDYFTDNLTIVYPSPGRACVTILIEDDGHIEFEENFFVRGEIIDNPELAVFQGSNVVNITIQEEIALIAFEPETYMTSEMVPSVDVCIAVTNGIVTFDTVVNLVVHPNSTATEGEDFAFETSPAAITIPAETSSGCITILILPTGTVEGEEVIHLSIADVTPDNVDQEGEDASVFIAGDGVVTIGFTMSEYRFTEGESLEVIVEKNGQFSSNIIFQVSGGPFETVTTFFTSGPPSETIVIPALSTPVDDSIALQPGFFHNVTLSVVEPAGDPQVVLVISEAIVIVTDDDGPVTVGFQELVQTVSEDAGRVVVLVGIDSNIAVPVIVDVVYNSGSAVEGEDFMVTGVSTVTFTDSSIRSIIVGIMDDPFTEGTESFTVELRNPQPEGVIISPNLATIEIIDNDNLVVLRFDREVFTASEGDRLELVVERVGILDSEIFFAVSGDGINEEGMFEAGASAANSISVFINISDDTIAPEPDEMFEVMLSLTQPNPLVSIPDPLATVVVIDNDPVVQFSPTAYTVREGDDRIVRATIELTPPTPEDIAIAIRLISDTAVVGEDIVNLGDPIFTLSAEAFGATLLLSNLIDDGMFEPNEMFFVEIFNVSIGAVGAQSRATVVIVDNDPVVQFSPTAYTVREGDDRIVRATIELTPPTPEDIAIAIRLISDTAVVGEDIVNLDDPIFTLSAEAFAATLLLSNLIDDSIVEETEMFFVEIVNVSIGAVGPQSRATIIILDNDDEIDVGFTQASVTVDEGDGTVQIPVTVSTDIAVPVTVDFQILSGTAMEGALTGDYVRTGLSSLTFTSSGTRNIPVAIVDDGIVEGSEFFTISLFNAQPSTVVLNPDTVTVTILDNDDITVTPPTPQVNYTIVGDPFYTAPVQVSGSEFGLDPSTVVSLCYEFHGEANQLFNIVNDVCTLVNARYSQPNPAVDVNIIDVISVRAVDSDGECVNISLTLEECSVTVDGAATDRYDRNGITVRRYADQSRVRVTVPNCASITLVMWMFCETGSVIVQDGVVAMDMIKFVIARGIGLSRSSHGLLGQMWNVQISVSDYTGDLGVLDPNDAIYYINIPNTRSIEPTTRRSRTFVAVLQKRSWDRSRGPCLYAGNRQAGPTGDIPEDILPNDPVIEGEYKDYIVSGKYSADCVFCTEFDESRCEV